MGLFRLPASVPGARPTVAQGGRYQEVTSETQLRAAIARAASVSGTTGVDSVKGMKIAIAAPMRFSAPVDIPPPAVGLEITSLGAMSITASALLDSAFIVRAPFCVLRGLFVPIPEDVNKRFSVFVAPGLWAASLAPINVTIDDCFIAADALYRDPGPSFMPTNWHITRNRFEMGLDAVPAIEGNAEDWLISGNTFGGCTDVITLHAASSYNRIEANNLGGGDVDTSATAGGNAIVGNPRIGAGSAFAASDAVGLNTP